MITLRFLERGLVFVLGLIALMRLCVWKLFPGGETFIKENGGNLLVAVAIFSAGILFIALKFAKREPVFRSGLETPLCLFFTAAAVSLFFTYDFSITTKLVLVLAAHLLFFVMLADLLSSQKRIKALLYFLLACAAVTAFFGIQEYFMLSGRAPLPSDKSLAVYQNSLYYILTSKRVTSFLGWPNVLAGFLMLFLPVVAGFLFMARNWWLRFFWLGLGLLLLGCFFLTFSFLGWLSFLLAISATALLLLRSRWKIELSPRQRIFIFAAGIVLLGLFVFVFTRKSFLGSLLPRVYYYKSALALLKSHPFFGVGYGAFRYASAPLIENRDAFSAYVHNSYLQAWVETGIAGCAALVWLFILFLIKSREVFCKVSGGKLKYLFLGVTAGVVAFFIDNFFSFTILKPNISLFGWLMLAVWAGLARQMLPPSQSVVESPLWSRVKGVLALGVLVLFFIAVFRMSEAVLVAYRADQALAGEDFTTGIALLQKTEILDSRDVQYPFALGVAFIKLYRLARSPDLIDRAEKEFLEAVRRSPHAYESYFILAKIYEYKKDSPRALDFSRRAALASPFEYQRDAQFIKGIF
ncbi:MAG: O-antigen ligase family protein [Candidatus Omnitrophica bacterium]|nr:O-antigen ligase family protein [Candidatus Omnitrophota bacterium]